MSTPCQRPDCAGGYEDMGGGELYCDTCGLAPVVSPQGLISSPPTGVTSGSGGTESGSSTGSARSASRSAASPRSVSGRLAGTAGHPGGTRSVVVRTTLAGTSSTSSRSRLGAGLVAVPNVPRPDPGSAVLAHPEVPEHRRFCSRGECGAPIGRSRGDRAGRTEGFCTSCGHPYSFVPKLRPGDVVHGQYEVVGCLAHGGLGWIYLAVDRAVSDRWVVLKGLLDTGDEDALAVAVAERRFLAEIEHANIVRIYNFVEHLDQRTGSLDGYIVMEYVGGKSLRDLANERRRPDGARDPLPVEVACAYGIEALGALGHLHSRNLLYCDFKVDNAIQQQDQLKLIDMGAVRRMDDDDSAIYGTVGYQAPEIAEQGASVASDLYTVARTLAVLTFDFQGYTTVFAHQLPAPDQVEVFRRYESFYRLLVRATDPDPKRRFASAEEMAGQLTGVLREVVALQSGEPRPAVSALFGSELRVADSELFPEEGNQPSVLGVRRTARTRRWRRAGRSTPPATRSRPAGQPAPHSGNPPPVASIPPQPVRPPDPTATTQPAVVLTAPDVTGGGPAPHAQPAGPAAPTGVEIRGAAPLPVLTPLDATAVALALPVPHVDPRDPHANLLAGLSASAPADVDAALRAASGSSVELLLRRVRALWELGDMPLAETLLERLQSDHGDDWRVVWHAGLHALTGGAEAVAAVSFDAVFDAFPGEPAPKLALAVCAELLGQLDNAAEYYRLVWTADPNYVSAAFGLARVRLTGGDRSGAVRVLESVPESSSYYTAARVAAVRARLRQRPPREASLADLADAARQVEQLARAGLDAVRRERLRTEVLGGALDWILSGGNDASSAASLPGGATALPALLGADLDERGLRFGLEEAYRVLARLTGRDAERIELVERANLLRPRTWV